MKLSLCITTYNRPELTVKAFENVANDPRISEIIIVDDHSTEKNFVELSTKCFPFNTTLYYNVENLGMSRNKMKAISLASNDWVIIFDSDNVLGKDYLDALEKVEFREDTIYMPVAALPHFDFTDFAGKTFNRSNVGSFMSFPKFRMCLNACNYVVHRGTYLQTYQYDPMIKGTDTIQHNYNHLLAGGSLYVVPSMTYEHLVHAESGFMADCNYNMAKAVEFENKIKQL